jgi:uncharacterized protein
MVTRTEKNQEQQEEIELEENKKIRKKKIIKAIKIIVVLSLVITALYFYVTKIATKALIVKETRIIDKKIPDSFNGTKIIQISDLDFGSTVKINDVKNLVNMINERKPDLVFFTGDLIDKKYKISSKKEEELIKLLHSIDASLGKYAIMGEKDGEKFTTIFNQSEFSILNNSYDLLYQDDDNPILLVGLASSLNKKQDIEAGYAYFREATHNANIYTITLLHEADSVDEILNKYPTDLFLAGNSLNGQIRIPYVGSIIKKEGSKKYSEAFYQLKNSKLFVSSGIGTEGLPIRIFCHPSINFFRISNK